MKAIKFITENFCPMGAFDFCKSSEWYGTLLDGDYCLNWWHNAQANKIEMHLFTPLPDCELNYKQEQNLLAKRFKKSKLVDKVVRIGAKRIDIYLK